LITFVKINESFTALQCPQHVLFEIAPHFEFYKDGYQYSPKYKKGHWDGKIKLISVTTGRFYTGLVKDVLIKLRELGYNEFSFKNFDKPIPEYTEEGILEAIEGFNLPEDKQVREHQLNAILTCLMGKRRLIESPTSSGKSLIIYIISRMLADMGYKVLIVTPTVMLVDQLFSDIEEYAEEDDFDVGDNYHKIFAGQMKNSKGKTLISTWQSIMPMDKEEFKDYMEQFDAVIVDEAHGADADSLKKIMEFAVNAKYRIGLSGTLKNSKTHVLVLRGLFGSIKKMISIRELMELGYIAKLKIKCILLRYPENIVRMVHGNKEKKIPKMDYDQELELVIGYEKRNKFIANLANSLKGNTLTILRFIDKHAVGLKELYDAKNNKVTYLLTGDTDKDEAMFIKNNMENLDNANLMGTYGKLATGISIINLHNGIIASPSKSKIKVLQFIGRLLRKGKNKDSAVVYDIVDNLVHEGEKNYMIKHFEQRYQYYIDEGFDVEIIQIDMK
jgi:superfamily II DNA or RNA helicase